MNDKEYEIIQKMRNEEYIIKYIETRDVMIYGKNINYLDLSENFLWITEHCGNIIILPTNRIESILLELIGDEE